MGEQEQFLASQYTQLDDEELLRMYRSGGLTDIAYGVLEKELRARKLSIPVLTSAPAFEDHSSFLDRAPFWARLVFLVLGSLLINLIYGAIFSTPPSAGGLGLSPSAAAAYATSQALKAVLFQGLPIVILVRVLFFRKKQKGDRARKTDA